MGSIGDDGVGREVVTSEVWGVWKGMDIVEGVVFVICVGGVGGGVTLGARLMRGKTVMRVFSKSDIIYY